MAALRAIVALLGGYRAAGFALAAVLALGLAGLQTRRLSHAETALADARTLAAERDAALAHATAQASELARLRERELATRTNAVAEAFERGKRYAENKGEATAADLRAGRLHFRRLWQECAAKSPGGVPGASTPAGEPDAGADDRAASAGRIVRAAAACDAQVVGLQNVIRAYTDAQHPGRTE